MPDFSPTAWVIIGILIAVEVVLFVTALIMVSRTPSERLTLPRVAWILLCFVQIIGPIAFFVLGRKPAPIEDTTLAQRRTSNVDSTIDELYG